MMLTTRTVDASEAHALGQVDTLAQAGELNLAVEDLAKAVLVN